MQDVDRQGIQARVQPRGQQWRSMPRCSLLRAAPTAHPAQDVPPSAAAGRTRTRLKPVMFLQAQRRDVGVESLSTGPSVLLAPRKMCNYICVLGCILQRDPPSATRTSCLVTVTVLDSTRQMARSEAACLMHFRVVTVASEARVSLRGASGETECRGVSGPIP